MEEKKEMKKLSKILSLLLVVLMMFSTISITAAAADTYTVKYHKNGGSGTMTNSTHTFGVEQALNPNKLTKSGHTFLGWAREQSATVPEFTDKQVVVDLATEGQTTVTLYAVWAPNTYYVEFRANSGEGSMANQTFTYGVEQELSANTFTKEGYTFLGWAKSGTTTKVSYDDKEAVRNLTQTNGATIVLYAVWEKNPVTVTSIFVSTEPAKKEYFVGDTFNATGLAIGVNLSDHTVKTITTGFEVSAPDMTTVGEKTVTVTYEGQTASFTINVVAKPEYNYTFSIVAPEVTEIANGESVVLSAKVEGFAPEGMYVVWAANNNNFAATANADGTYTVVAGGAGATVFTATLYTAEGEQVAQETVELTALEKVEEPEEPGFFAKIINFFKGIIAAILGIFKK